MKTNQQLILEVKKLSLGICLLKTIMKMMTLNHKILLRWVKRESIIL